MSSTAHRWWLAVTLVAAWPGLADAQCTDADRAAAAAAATLVGEDALPQADDRLRLAYSAAPACDDLAIAAWSLRGWRAARAASASGGRPEDLAPVREAVDRLASLGGEVSSAAYATALVRAAAAASQDERDEMSLWLDHARDLDRRLTVDAVSPGWPLEFDQAEGELWLEVDDYELAEAALSRAVTGRATAAAWRGLARALDRQAKTYAACDAYRRVVATLGPGAVPSPLKAEAEAAIAACPP